MKAHLLYLRYVVRHKWFVLVAGLKTRAPLWRLLIHDWSKFTPAEWGPYVAHFYGRAAALIARDWAEREIERRDRTRTTTLCGQDDGVWRAARWVEKGIAQAREDAFNRAWLHHQHTNPHHWQHWVLNEESGLTRCLEMPDPLVREMVADWMGAGRAITGRWEVAEWYAKNREVIRLHPLTRGLVEDLIREVAR